MTIFNSYVTNDQKVLSSLPTGKNVPDLLLSPGRPPEALLGGSSHLVSKLFHPNYKWIFPCKNPTEITRDITYLLMSSHDWSTHGLSIGGIPKNDHWLIKCYPPNKNKPWIDWSWVTISKQVISPVFAMGFLWDSSTTMGNHNFSWINPLFLWWFSIANC